jgi:hypothetical protein
LFKQVFHGLKAIGLGAILRPLSFGVLAMYTSGLLLLDRRQNGTRISVWLPVRCHDAINRLLNNSKISSRALMRTVLTWAKRLGKGYLAIDDMVTEKRFSKLCGWMGWTYSNADKRKVYGFHVVVLLWCSGCWRIPVAFRIWRPKAKCQAKNYRKKSELAWEMLIEVFEQELSIDYIAMDTLYSAGWLTKKINRMGLKWVGVLHPHTTICYRNKRWSVKTLSAWLKLKYRQSLGLRARSIRAYLPKYGHLRLVVTKNRHGNIEVLATNDLDTDLTTIVLRKRSRWSIETLFRDAKQFSGLTACQCRSDQALVSHVAFVLLSFILLQRFRQFPEETLGVVKERLQMQVFTGGLRPPAPLRGKVADYQLTA